MNMNTLFPTAQLVDNLAYIVRNLNPQRTKVILVSDYQQIMQQYNLPIHSNSSGKMKRKTKMEMFNDLYEFYEQTKIKHQQVITELSNNFDHHRFQSCFPIIIYETMDRSIKSTILKLDDNPKNYLIETHSLNPDLYTFGSFIRLCKSYYIIDHKNSLLECFPYICTTENKAHIVFINIPEEITEYLSCAPTFFGIIGDDLLNKKKYCQIVYENDFDTGLIIQSLPLALHDKYIVQRFGNIEKDDGFSFELKYIDYMKNYYLVLYIFIFKEDHTIQKSKHLFILKPNFDHGDLYHLKEKLFLQNEANLQKSSHYMKIIYPLFKDKIYCKVRDKLM